MNENESKDLPVLKDIMEMHLLDMGSGLKAYHPVELQIFIEVKNAAIAWVRAIRLAEENRFGDYGAEVDELHVSCEYDADCDYIEQWIMRFFGLAEEDVAVAEMGFVE